MKYLSTNVFKFTVAMLALSVFSQVQASSSLPEFTRLVEKNSPSVVNISTTQKIKKQSRLPENLKIPDLPEDSPFNEFFRRFLDEEGHAPEQRDAKSLGSGFIISSDGYVMTNNHVVKGADEVIVRLSDRREFSAKVVGTDERSDVAVLKIDATNLPVVKIGKSKKLKVGEWVLAIGSPFGFDHSVTAGIVSAKGRSLPRENYVPFIQTDVAINPGNSGGPLFNLDGEVVGVNSQIYSRTGGFMGLSFAIPIEVAMNVADQLKNEGHVTRGWLGVLIQDVTAELAESFGMDKPRGALVSRVLPDSPASKAGFQVGDIVLKFNHEDVEHSKDLPPLVGSTKIDIAVPVRVLRQGKMKTLKVVIGELPAEGELRATNDNKPTPTKQNRIGVVATDLTNLQRKKREIAKGGVLINKSSGAANRAGIRPGDVVVMLNNENISDIKQFEKLVKDLPANRSVPVLIHRARGGPVFLALKITDDE